MYQKFLKYFNTYYYSSNGYCGVVKELFCHSNKPDKKYLAYSVPFKVHKCAVPPANLRYEISFSRTCKFLV